MSLKASVVIERTLDIMNKMLQKVGTWAKEFGSVAVQTTVSMMAIAGVFALVGKIVWPAGDWLLDTISQEPSAARFVGAICLIALNAFITWRLCLVITKLYCRQG
jgi:diacylglycerol kinase